MSRCRSCNGRGFIEGWRGESNVYTPSIEQCPKRCDISAYSQEVQRRLSNQVSRRQPIPQIPSTSEKHVNSVTNVIPLRRRSLADDRREDVDGA